MKTLNNTTTTPEPHFERILVTVKEAAQMLSMGRSTFWQHVKNGALPKPVKIGGLTRWRLADLRRHCEPPPASEPTTP